MEVHQNEVRVFESPHREIDYLQTIIAENYSHEFKSHTTTEAQVDIPHAYHCQ